MVASTSQLLLTRIDHEAKMLNVMRNLFEEGHLTDVTLACEGQLLHAHKLILSSVSNYFQTIFQNPALRTQNNPVIMVKDMKMTDLKAIIEFVYSGEVRIGGDQLESLVKSAETLDISGLNRIDPNPVANKTSHTPNKSNGSSENNLNSSFVKKSTNGLVGKSPNVQDDSSLSRKESGTNSRTSCDRKSETNSVRGTRSRCFELSGKVGNGRKTSQENIASSGNSNSITNETINRETRYMSRSQLKELKELKEEMNRSTNILDEAKTARDRLSSSPICEPTPKGKTSTNGKITNGDQTKNENECHKDVDQKLTNISNQTPEFKKPQQRTRKCKKSSDTVYPPNEDYMRQFVCNKERLSMNLKSDDDVQSVSSVTTRSHRHKLMEESGSLPRNVSPAPSNRSVTSTRTKKPTTSSKPPVTGPRGKRTAKVKAAAPNLSSRTTRGRGTESVRWKARAAKLRAVAATRRLAAKSRCKRAEWKTWFDNQAKMLQNATGKPRVRREVRIKQTNKSKNEDNSIEVNRISNPPTTTAQLTIKSLPISYMPNPFVLKLQEPNPPQALNNQNLSHLQQSATNPNLIQEFTNDFELEFEPKPKRKQNEVTLDPDPSKREQTISSQAATSSGTRTLRPKRVKTTSDSSDNPPSTANTSGSSLYTTISLSSSPIPTSSSLITATQPAGDPSL